MRFEHGIFFGFILGYLIGRIDSYLVKAKLAKLERDIRNNNVTITKPEPKYVKPMPKQKYEKSIPYVKPMPYAHLTNLTQIPEVPPRRP